MALSTAETASAILRAATYASARATYFVAMPAVFLAFSSSATPALRMSCASVTRPSYNARSASPMLASDAPRGPALAMVAYASRAPLGFSLASAAIASGRYALGKSGYCLTMSAACAEAVAKSPAYIA